MAKNSSSLARSRKALSKQAISKNARTKPNRRIGQTPPPRKLRRRIDREQIIKDLKYFSDPDYQQAYSNGRGGRKATAVLGPGIAELARDGFTNAESSALPKLAMAREAYPHLGLVAGHLLNARFGGIGNASNNLTILSSSGNRNHQAFDNPVIQAVGYLYDWYDLLRQSGMNVSNLRFGIEVSILVSKDVWGHQEHDRFICKHLTCQANLSGAYPNLNGLLPSGQRKAQDLIHNIILLLDKANDGRPEGRKVVNTKR
jgi:hypothetical protein